MNQHDIIFNIFQFFDVKNILKCALINKLFYHVSNNNYLWKLLFENHYKEDIEIYKKLFKFESNKKIFIKYFKIDKIKCILPTSTDIINVYNSQVLYINKPMTTIPKEIGQLLNLQSLNLMLNFIKIIPKEIGKLLNLKELYLSHNDITVIPKEIGKLLNLEELYLSNNNITKIPKEIGKLLNLKKLNLSNNNIIEIPKEIGQLINLQCMTMYGNSIKKLPEEIGQLINLKKLHLDDKNVIIPKEL